MNHWKIKQKRKAVLCSGAVVSKKTKAAKWNYLDKVRCTYLVNGSFAYTPLFWVQSDVTCIVRVCVCVSMLGDAFPKPLFYDLTWEKVPNTQKKSIQIAQHLESYGWDRESDIFLLSHCLSGGIGSYWTV